MIIGIGTDIIEIDRIERVISQYGQKFLDRTFTSEEQKYCQKHAHSARHYAGRFAAKEAIVKAMGTGIVKGIGWTDIEIINDSAGKPLCRLSEELNERLGTPDILISISHSKEYATAVALIQ